MPICGGNWNNTSNAGVFNVNLNNPRTNANGNIGFRSALLSYARNLKESISAPTVWKEKKWFYSCVGRAVPVETHKAGDTYGGRK